MEIGLIDKIKLRANQVNPTAAAAYREALRDVGEFLDTIDQLGAIPENQELVKGLMTRFREAISEADKP